MPSVISHAVAGSALGMIGRPSRDLPVRFWIAAAIAPALPDVDVLAFRFGIPYTSMYGHRGFSHSFFFAAALSAFIVALLFRERTWRPNWGGLWLFFFIVIASHGILDALTDGTVGVAFFAPFSAQRYFFTWHPILVSPIGVTRFLSRRGAAVLVSEVHWIWLPSLIVAAAGWIVRRRRPSSAEAMSQP